jgi:glycosyltransferase involved in cell wall biosynthesis
MAKSVPTNETTDGKHFNPAIADVCFLTEGTYPYVTGGVSSWIHQLISAMPDVSFSLVNIVPSSETPQKFRYKLPDNVINLLNVYLHDAIIHDNKTPRKQLRKRAYHHLRKFHDEFPLQQLGRFKEVFDHFCSPTTRSINTDDIISSEEGWEIIVDLYKERSGDSSFIDYFWTWRFLHLPLFQVLNCEIPRARVYHAVSTGYAGLVGAVAKLRYNSPLILTEHGIYTKERDIEISRSEWIYSDAPERIQARKNQGFFKEIWKKFFTFLGHITYEYADEIITLYGGNQQLQLKYGAPKEKCSVIPNAIKPGIFYPLRENMALDDVKKVGFVGRVVPIKDVKTFIKACRMVADKYDKVEFWILGPTDEDPEYFHECENLNRLLSMEEKLKFFGKVDVREYYPKLDVFVLTSISEGQPLTILEAMAVGVPSVSTRVGSCEELINGRTKEDLALGPAGLVTNIGKPRETAEAIYKIISSKELHDQMVESGYKRVDKYYREDALIEKYRQLYNDYAAKSGIK